MNSLFKSTVVILLVCNLFGLSWLLATRPSRAECHTLVDNALKEREASILKKYVPVLNDMESGFGFPTSSPKSVEELVAAFGKIVFKPVPSLEKSE